MLPLTIKQTRSMQEMQRVQPMLKKLQEKYKDDKPKLQEEMMKFYSEHKINPLGGCLPMLLQFPILIALFRMLTFEPPLIIQNVPYNFWIFIPDLSKAASTYPPPAQWVNGLPYYVLVLLMIVTTYVPQKMMTKDPQQEKIMILMSIFMAWIAWSLPAGVIVYWVTTNVWTIGQQWMMMREQPAAATTGSTGGTQEPGRELPEAGTKGSGVPPAVASGGKGSQGALGYCWNGNQAEAGCPSGEQAGQRSSSPQDQPSFLARATGSSLSKASGPCAPQLSQIRRVIVSSIVRLLYRVS